MKRTPSAANHHSRTEGGGDASASRPTEVSKAEPCDAIGPSPRREDRVTFAVPGPAVARPGR